MEVGRDGSRGRRFLKTKDEGFGEGRAQTGWGTTRGARCISHNALRCGEV